MSKARSVCRDWEFVSKGTEISLGKFVSEYFTPLTLDTQSSVVSTEDTDKIWKESREESMEKVKGRANRQVRADSPRVDEAEVEKSFWLSRSDGWVMNRKLKKIVLLEFKRTSDYRESYTPYHDRSQSIDGRKWEVVVVPLIVGQRSVREKEWMETLRIFGIGKEVGRSKDHCEIRTHDSR
jgi:hypothetical protein